MNVSATTSEWLFKNKSKCFDKNDYFKMKKSADQFLCISSFKRINETKLPLKKHCHICLDKKHS